MTEVPGPADRPSPGAPGAGRPDWSGRRVVVVGASSGIGRAVALEAARAGARVVAVGRRADRLAELVAATPGISSVAADVTEPADCTRLADRVAAEPNEADEAGPAGGADLVVYAAGCATLRRLADMEPADWQRILTTNLVGFNQVVAALVGQGLAQDAIVAALSSETVGHPRHGLAGYGVSKAALEEAVRAWRLEQPALRFCTVQVGATQPTDFGADFDGEALGPVLDDWISHGLLPTAFMDTDELATSLVRVLGSMVSFPGITIEELRVRPSAPPLTDVAQLGADPHPDRPAGGSAP